MVDDPTVPDRVSELLGWSIVNTEVVALRSSRSSRASTRGKNRARQGRVGAEPRRRDCDKMFQFIRAFRREKGHEQPRGLDLPGTRRAEPVGRSSASVMELTRQYKTRTAGCKHFLGSSGRLLSPRPPAAGFFVHKSPAPGKIVAIATTSQGWPGGTSFGEEVPMALQLVVLDGPDKDTVFTLQQGPDLMLGRGANSLYHLNDTSVSRSHC